MLNQLRLTLAGFDWTPPERRCVYCGHGWLTWYGQRVRHTECWVGMGFAPILYTEMGERYLRDDPVPPLRTKRPSESELAGPNRFPVNRPHVALVGPGEKPPN